MKNTQYRTVGTIPKSKRKFVERGITNTPSKQIHDHSLPWIGTCTSIKGGGIKHA